MNEKNLVSKLQYCSIKFVHLFNATISDPKLNIASLTSMEKIENMEYYNIAKSTYNYVKSDSPIKTFKFIKRQNNVD